MGFTLSQETLTVYRVQGDGVGGYWWMSVAADGTAYSGGYNATTALIRVAAAPIYAVETFRELMVAMITNSVTLPQRDMNINMDEASDVQGLNAQFQDPALSDSDVGNIFANYDPVDLLVKFGIFPLVRRAYLLGHLTLIQLRDVLLGLGAQGKIARTKVVQVLDYLKDTDGVINQTQYDNFLDQFDAL